MRERLRAVGVWIADNIRDLFLFGGLVALWIGVAGFDERVAYIVLGAVLLYLAVPPVRGRHDSEGG